MVPNVVNILAVIDAKWIFDNYPNPSLDPKNPTILPEMNSYAYLIVDLGAYSGQGISALVITIPKEQEDQESLLRWRVCTTSLGTEYQCFLTNVVVDKGAEYVSAPRAHRFDVNIPSIDAGKFVAFQDQFWECKINGAGGQMIYNLVFAIVDKEGNPKGHYTWDPIVYIQ